MCGSKLVPTHQSVSWAGLNNKRANNQNIRRVKALSAVRKRNTYCEYTYNDMVYSNKKLEVGRVYVYIYKIIYVCVSMFVVVDNKGQHEMAHFIEVLYYCCIQLSKHETLLW